MKFNRECEIEKVCTAPKMCRPPLENVWYDSEKSRLIATDGKIMAIVPAEKEDGDVSGYVSPLSIKEYRRAAKKSFVTLQCNSSLKIGGMTLERPTVENMGTFPNVEQVIPKDDTDVTVTIVLNAELLATLAAALGSEIVTLKIRKPEMAISVSTAKGKGLIMPVKVA